MTKTVNILGATGSIGRSALDVLSRHRGEWRVRAIASGSRVRELAEAAAACGAEAAAVADPALKDALAAELRARGLATEALAGPEALCTIAGDRGADAVVLAASGAAGLPQAFAAARAGRRMLLANKESVVCGGALLQSEIRRHGASVFPVDSEHSAIFQCLAAATPGQRASAVIWLTCSGGPFRTRLDLSNVTIEEASTHPRWKMGRKITVDSATLMNKGLEVIEARWLFDIPAERIRVVVHPESVIHSAVAYCDGAVMAELGVPDMRTPIAVALAWPQRIESGAQPLDLLHMKPLTFEAPDTQRFPLLAMAYEALREGGGAPIVLNAANEVAVEAFLGGRIPFLSIAEVCRRTLEQVHFGSPDSPEEILEDDRRAREAARGLIDSSLR
ncbi:1-deoxy-D-xylulose-5-phosphate reductoisomerase [Mesosutterella sp. AGMB02718]|uniref:1-deoxy-D-xylulose 5-phosphate reductoisomerase n=1 Tax=Mesosutterella faecium TaxID=2925194 RepID=A0ABT7IQR7_9BURK|nr:1-deoxy-D-xylulose-5-phosphate reductoisomerase [Mesosutterella sp. AGMB02718]MDL2059627.1 1-deoxy-D-xylulose-5-phosphate reductoisomerase [Mesosutterella sp. AGMB02718]